jgi:hypothetical protein
MRVFALLMLLIPGIFAVVGVKLMRDAFFGIIFPFLFHSSIQFVLGIILFVMGLWFIGGFILHRDKKRNLTKGRFSRERTRRN